MPAAVIGLALVGGGAITVATLGYVALGVTVAGMVTGNKTLQKIGGQLGLAAGVAGIATSFMGAGTSALSTAGNVAKVATGAGSASDDSSILKESAALDSATPDRAERILNGETVRQPGEPYFNRDAYVGMKYVDQGGPSSSGEGAGAPRPDPVGYTAPELIGGNEGTTQGITEPLGATQGTNLAPTGPVTANDPAGSNPRAKPDSGFLDNIFGGMKNADGTYKDSSKYMMMEGGKIIAGGLQGLSTTSNANAQLAEKRRLEDIQRANLNSVGRGSYGLMTAR